MAPVLAPGATAGTFTASGIGLRIDAATGVINLATTNIDGTFTITNTIAGTGACSSFATTTTFTVLPGVATPSLTATPQANGTVLLSTGTVAGATYQFFRNAVAVGPASGSNTLLLAGGSSQNGNYTVVVISGGGCRSADSAPVAVVVTAATASANGLTLRVYPNPTPTGTVTLELTGARNSASAVTVLNALGQVVHTGTLAASAEQLTLRGLAAGVYTVRVQTSAGVLTQRLVRE